MDSLALRLRAAPNMACCRPTAISSPFRVKRPPRETGHGLPQRRPTRTIHRRHAFNAFQKHSSSHAGGAVYLARKIRLGKPIPFCNSKLETRCQSFSSASTSVPSDGRNTSLKETWRHFKDDPKHDLSRRYLFTAALILLARVIQITPLEGPDKVLIAPMLPKMAIFTEFLGPSERVAELTLMLVGFTPMFIASTFVQGLASSFFDKKKFQNTDAGFPLSIISDIQFMQKSDDQDGIQNLLLTWTVIVSLIMGMGLAWTMRATFPLAVQKWAWVQFGLKLAAGAVMVKWISDRVTNHGIGEGSGVILSLFILNQYIGSIKTIVSSFVAGEMAVAQLSLFFGFFVVMIMGAICLQYGCLKVRLTSYNKDLLLNSKQLKEEFSTFMPFPINPGGMAPLIATSFLVQFLKEGANALARSTNLHAPALLLSNHLVYYSLHFALCLMMNLVDLRSTPGKAQAFMTRIGTRVEGVKPGEATIRLFRYLQCMTRMWGGCFLASMVTLGLMVDDYMLKQIGVTIGYTSMMIVVGTVLQAKRQIESLKQMPKLKEKIEEDI